jgi:hypothetical protein
MNIHGFCPMHPTVSDGHPRSMPPRVPDVHLWFLPYASISFKWISMVSAPCNNQFQMDINGVCPTHPTVPDGNPWFLSYTTTSYRWTSMVSALCLQQFQMDIHGFCPMQPSIPDGHPWFLPYATNSSRWTSMGSALYIQQFPRTSMVSLLRIQQFQMDIHGFCRDTLPSVPDGHQWFFPMP